METDLRLNPHLKPAIIVDAEQARDYLVSALKHKDAAMKFALGGADVSLPKVMVAFLRDHDRPDTHRGMHMIGISHAFMDAAWQLCTENILRPGPATMLDGARADEIGLSYSITARGKAWLATHESKKDAA